MEPAINATTIALIPKITEAARVKDFRPIACCNVVYKIVTKLMTMRLRPILQKLISKNQGAFLDRRLIQENVWLMHDLVKNYQAKGGAPRCAIKIDIMKAYDTVRWGFLLRTMKVMGFPTNFIEWTWQCISTARFSVSINGELVDFFKAKRGLRQGDPMSPYLFLLVMEVFGKMLGRTFEKEQLKYHPRCQQLKLSYVAFADDLFVMARAHVPTLKSIRETLEQFGKISGLNPNKEKSAIFVAGCTAEEEAQMTEAIGFPKENLPVRYLGVPLVASRLRERDCLSLIDRIKGRINGWANIKLTYGGRLQLIKSVAVSIQSYWSSIYLLPRRVLKTINSMLSQFLWKGKLGQKGGERVAWKQVCQSHQRGGLDIPNLSHLNSAMMLKTLWDICKKKETLWIQWVHQVILNGCTLWDYQPRQADSWLIKALMEHRDLLRDRTKAVIGDGKSTSFFHANWHEKGPLCNMKGIQHFKTLLMIPEGTIVDMLVEGRWRWEREHQRLDAVCQAIAQQIGSPPAMGGTNDRICWIPGGTGDFTLRSAVQSLGEASQDVPWADQVWWRRRIPRYAVISWMIQWKRLPTADRLIKWGVGADPKCCLCADQVETHEHLFYTCKYARKVWAAVMKYCGIAKAPYKWKNCQEWWRTKPGTSSFQRELVLLANSVSAYSIWWERNKRLNEKEYRGHQTVSSDVKNTIRIYAGGWRGVRKTKTNWERCVEMGISMAVFLKKIDG